MKKRNQWIKYTVFGILLILGCLICKTHFAVNYFYQELPIELHEYRIGTQSNGEAK